jgi:hypothetical protein
MGRNRIESERSRRESYVKRIHCHEVKEGEWHEDKVEVKADFGAWC